MAQTINTILASIANVGYLTFGVFVLVSVLLWKIHPVLGILGVVATIAKLLGYI